MAEDRKNPVKLTEDTLTILFGPLELISSMVEKRRKLTTISFTFLGPRGKPSDHQRAALDSPDQTVVDVFD